MEQVAEKNNYNWLLHMSIINCEKRRHRAQYLATYCQQRELTYYETRWEDPEKQRNLEAKARTFRYEFLKKSWKLKVRRS